MQNRIDDQVYAGLFVRLAAYLTDLLIVGAVLLIIRIPFGIFSLSHPDGLLVRNFIFKYSIIDIVLYALKVTYFVLLTYRSGATIGKKLFHLKVLNADEGELTLFQVIYRETIGRFLSGVILNLGYLLIIVDKNKCGVHDLLADTRVVYYHERKVYAHSDIHYKNMIYQGNAYNNQPNGMQSPAHQKVENTVPMQHSEYQFSDSETTDTEKTEN